MISILNGKISIGADMNWFSQQVTPEKGCSIVIFGASGDLAKKKLFPSLYQLYKDNQLPSKFYIVGYARTKMTTETFKAKLQEISKYDDHKFFDNITYISGQYNESEEMRSLQKYFDRYSLNRLFYLSLPPTEFRNVCRALQKTKLITKNSGSLRNAHTIIGEQPFTRVVIEKPFGTDFESALKLERFLSKHFEPDQIFAIDHYLGKEPIQNILFFRFANSIFENLWNGKYIDNIQIFMDEEITIDKRAGYFDSAGILRDMVQSHGLQLLSLVMMEPPSDFSAEQIRSEKSKLLSSLKVLSTNEVKDSVIRAQYDGYLKEEGVLENSQTETMVVIRTEVNNWRWSGTPIYIRTGKALKRKKTEVVITFKPIPYNMMGTSGPNDILKNRLVFRLQPDTNIKLRMMSKVPGHNIQMVSTEMDFPYDVQFKEYNYVNGYDRILYSAFINDATLFLSSKELFAQWKFTDAIINAWKEDDNIPLYTYQKGSDGPQEIFELVKKDGNSWNL